MTTNSQTQKYLLWRCSYDQDTGLIKIKILSAPYSGWIGKRIKLPMADYNVIITEPENGDNTVHYNPKTLIDYLERTFPEDKTRLKKQREQRVEQMVNEMIPDKNDPNDDSGCEDTKIN